jgi:carbamoyltransferase
MTFIPYEAPRRQLADGDEPFRRILGLHLNGHDTSASVVVDGKLVEVIEYERVIREKHCRLNVLHPRYEKFMSWLFNDYGMDPAFDAVALHLHTFGSEPREYYAQVQSRAVEVAQQYIPSAHFLQLNHHLCHASSSYFTSPFGDAAILSIDGHGNDGSAIGFVADGSNVRYVKGWPYSLGRAYSALSNIIGGIYAKDGNAAGKVMGLTAYGKIREDWKAPIRRFITTYTGIRSEFSPLFWEASVADGVFDLPGYGPVLGKSAFKGPEDLMAQDFAATYQDVWSEVVQDMVRELLSETGKSRICLVGGCALNAATNFDILQMPEVADIHLVPHPSDMGISAGAALYAAHAYQGSVWTGATEKYMSAYLGVPILDRNSLEAVANDRAAERLAAPALRLAKMVASGAKLGIMNGRSELGPRALGNRSIICDPRNPDMKDIINNQIKGREWYRPFAPVVREGDQNRYFFMTQPAPYMSFIAHVRPEWADRIPSVVHADGTARVQTVSQEQNPFLWHLIEAFEKETGVGILLNTSFNGQGEPVMARISEALSLLDGTDLDAVFIEGYLFQ